MAHYNTHQKKMLVDFLESHSGRAFSVDEIVSAMSDTENEAPGRSTVYRLLNGLCADGTVKRFPEEGGNRFLYQLAGGEECHHHLHLKCNVCGRLLHMEDNVSDEVLHMIAGESGFDVDREQTTLFGKCKECRNK